MLRSAEHLRGYRIAATDDTLGKVEDFLFDEDTWMVRYMVADTHRWLPGRRVLIPPSVMESPDWRDREFPVELTREQVRESPDLAEDEPVSRQREVEVFQHFGWAPYWVGPGGAYSGPVAPQAAKAPAKQDADQDPSLRSVREVSGYAIRASDGMLGHVEDMILEDETWQARYLVIDTRNWLPAKKVLISPSWAEEIRWDDRSVTIALTREQIKSAPEYNPNEPVNRALELRLYDFHGKPRYWET